ncbi:MAG: alpha/beta hydrolase [Bacteroidales bacterium]|nr:alpha/beta hydrolase [Bacteroidales bacterium]
MIRSRKFYFLLFAFGALYLLGVQQFFKNEGKLLLKSATYPNEFVYSFSTTFQELNLTINQDVDLNGIWFRHAESRGIILFFPDSEEDLANCQIDQSAYFKSGFDVLITAYRGTAKSKGDLRTEADLFSDAMHWYNFAKSQFTEKNILLFGKGFGASIAAELASNHINSKLILIAPHYTYSDYAAKNRFWFIPYKQFSSFPLKTWEYLRKNTSEVILVINPEELDKKTNLGQFIKASDAIYYIDSDHAIPEKINKKIEEIYLSLNQELISKQE